MSSFHENEDRTTSEAEFYRYLYTPMTLRALQVTESQSAVMETRAKRPGNKREIFFATWTFRGVLLLIVLAAYYIGVRVERHGWLTPTTPTASP